MILEWQQNLKDGNTISHYTSAQYLILMLQQNALKGSEYSFSLSKEKEPNEVSTMRKSMDPLNILNAPLSKEQKEKYTKRGVEKLDRVSSTQKDVEIKIFQDKLKNTLRRAKTNKINEVPLMIKERLKKDMIAILKGNEKLKPIYELLLKDFDKGLKEYLKLKKDDLDEKDFLEIESKINQYKKILASREGEERVEGNIPLDSKYLEIKLLPRILENKKNLKRLKEEIAKREELFVKDETYKEFMA
jgi:hypothetical protein